MPLSCSTLVLASILLITMPASLSAQTDAPSTCPGGLADQQIVQVSTAFAQSIASIVPRIDLVLDSLGYKVARRDTVAGIWVTAPSYRWPLGSEDEDWHGKESPGVRVAVFVQQDSAGRSLVVSGQVLCNLKDQATAAAPESVESVLEMLATIQVMSSLGPSIEKPK